MPSSAEVAEKQPKSSSGPKRVVFKTPQRNRARRGAGAGGARTLPWDGSFVCSRHPSPSSLPTRLLGGLGARTTARAGTRWPSRDAAAEAQRGDLLSPGPLAGACRRGGGCAGGWPASCARGEGRAEGTQPPPPRPPSSRPGGDGGREGVRGPPPSPRAGGRADAQSRQKTYSV